MTMTAVQVCNLALGTLGQNPDVTSIAGADVSVNGMFCQLFYPQAVAVLLDAHAWSFAMVTTALTLATNANPLWQYAYTPPSDFFGVTALVAVGFSDELQLPSGENFALEGGLIYSNIQNAVLKYTSNAAAVSPFPTTGFNPLFVQALVTLLASYLAGPTLKGDVGAAAGQKYFELYRAALATAVASDAQYRKVRPQYVPTAVRARYFAGVGLPAGAGGVSWADLGPVGGTNVA